MISWSLQRKKEGISCTIYFVRRNFFQHLCFLPIYSVLNTFRIYIKKLYGPFLWMGFNCLRARAILRKQFTFYISKSITSYTFLLVFKIVKSLQCILNLTSQRSKVQLATPTERIHGI